MFSVCVACVFRIRAAWVWQPILGIGHYAIAWTVQRLSDLLPVTASNEKKQEELQSLADKMIQKDASAGSKMCLGFEA